MPSHQDKRYLKTCQRKKKMIYIPALQIWLIVLFHMPRATRPNLWTLHRKSFQGIKRHNKLLSECTHL